MIDNIQHSHLFVHGNENTCILWSYIVEMSAPNCTFYIQEAIAYFPLVLLITELFANTGIKRIRKILGNKVKVIKTINVLLFLIPTRIWEIGTGCT